MLKVGYRAGVCRYCTHPQAIKLRRQIAVARSHYRKRGLQEEVGDEGEERTVPQSCWPKARRQTQARQRRSS